jgi:hypothetical protein
VERFEKAWTAKWLATDKMMGFTFRHGSNFPVCNYVQTSSGAHPPSYLRLLDWWESGWNVKLTTHPHLVLILKMCGLSFPLPTCLQVDLSLLSQPIPVTKIYAIYYPAFLLNCSRTGHFLYTWNSQIKSNFIMMFGNITTQWLNMSLSLHNHTAFPNRCG